MDLSKLFQLQRQLDERIEREHPRQEGEDRLAKKILALQVELGELCNCWRGFKFWSNDQKPRRTVHEICKYCEGRKTLGFQLESCWYCGGTGLQVVKRPLLEEYVDCLHFILSIGLEKDKYREVEFHALYVDGEDVVMQFNVLFDKVGDFYVYQTKDNYQIVLSLFLALGEMLGLTREQIEEAYMQKNAVNHERQEMGY
jgi:dimeric dUTPase (all-alpha-NTP-PPase superfamily)